MISIQVSIKHQRPATLSAALLRNHISLADGQAADEAATWPVLPLSDRPDNIPINSADDATLLEKLGLSLDELPTHTQTPNEDLPRAGDIIAALRGCGGTHTHERSLKRPLRLLPAVSKQDECLSARPTKKLRTTTARKTVSFVSDVSTLHEVIPNQPGELYESDERWYSRSDYNSFRQDMKMNFFMHSLWMRNTQDHTQSTSPPADMCIRGLEKFCFYSNQADMKDMRRLRQQAILDQQDIQKALGEADPMTLRLVAEVLSNRALDQATERGATDSVAAASSS